MTTKRKKKIRDRFNRLAACCTSIPRNYLWRIREKFYFFSYGTREPLPLCQALRGGVDSSDSHQVYFVVSYQKLRMDYTFVAIQKDNYFVKSQITPIMLDQEINLTTGEFICIVQHPGGKPKQLSQDRISSVKRPYIKYEADTKSGSSGSPVFTSKDMKAIAIHLSGKEGAFNKGTLLR